MSYVSVDTNHLPRLLMKVRHIQADKHTVYSDSVVISLFASLTSGMLWMLAAQSPHTSDYHWVPLYLHTAIV